MKKIYHLFLLIALLFGVSASAQTTLVSPTGDGGFESGLTLAANNWTAVNSSTDQWTIGNAPTVFAGSNCGYTSTAPGGAWTYSQISTIQHLYRDIVVPAGTENIATLNFKWKVGGEGTTTSDWDNMKIFLAPTTVTPTANTAVSATYQITGPGAVSGMYKLNSASYNDETINLVVTPGTTYRLIFSWKSDGSDIVPPPACIDNVSFVVRPPAAVSSTAIGGLWSSPATWQTGVVPNYENVTIADGATVTIDQVAIVNNLTVGQGASGILQWNGTANALTATGNVLVNTGAKLNMFTAVASPNGVTVNVYGNFVNNGTVHSAYANANHSLINFNGTAANPNSTLAGTGTFVGGIISGLFFQNLGSNSITTSQNITTRGFALTAGSLTTNNKLTIDNTAQFYGQAINQQIYEVAVTAMGSGYNTATPPTVTIAAPTGTGVTATATPNIDNVTGTLRSITITNPGDGYRANPTVTISGGTGTGAAATAVVNNLSVGTASGLTQKSGGVTISGNININSTQSVGAAAVTAGGVGYASVPDVGFALPFGFHNLVTAGGSGYTAAPTVTVSGGVALTGSTNPTFTVVVAQGKVVSVIAAGGGTLWQVPPTLTITGGGGSGATAAYPANCLATGTATVSNGMVSNITITNAGSGYTAAPTVGLVGGGATTAATGATSRIGVYNMTLNNFIPSPAAAVHQDDATVPANRRVNVLTMTLGGMNLNSGLELYSATPITLTNGLINVGNNTVYFSNPSYAGTTGSTTSSISGVIRLSTPGGSITRTFPFDASFAVATGTGSLATGSTVTSLTVTRTGAPSGSAIPTGTARGTRAYRLQSDIGAVYGTNPTVTMNYNGNDALVSDVQSLYIGQGSGGITGPWTVVSTSTGAGVLPATGSRTTATVAPGPIVPTGDDYFAWTSDFSVVNSIASGDWNNGATWSTGIVPVCTDNVIINNTHTVTVNSAANVSRTLGVATGGTLVVASGDLTVGCTLKNNPLSNNGTLTVTGGVLNINGNLAIATGSKFNQSGGDINIDGNDAGTVASSVPSGTVIFNIVAAAAADINLTGGTITVVDPHVVSGTNTIGVSYGVAGSIVCGAAHTLRLGDGVSTDPGSTAGMVVNSWVTSGLMTFGNIVLQPVVGGANRFVSTTGTWSAISARNITINSGAELRSAGTAVTGAVIFSNNLTVNAGGTLTSLGFVYAGNATPATATTLTFTPSANAQLISGAGTFRNAATAPTANLVSLSIDNSEATGVTLGVPLTMSGTLNLVNGNLNTSTGTLLTVGYSGSNLGTMNRTAGKVVGPLKKWYAASTGTATFPLGSSTLYKPATINFTTAPSAAGTLTASFSSTPPNFPNAAPLMEGALVINKASIQGSWFVEAGDGLTGGVYTGTFTGNGANDVLDYTKTVLIKRPSIGGEWALDGTHVTTTGSNTAPVVSRTGMANFAAEFAIGGEVLVALPIAIDYFRGTKQTDRNLLDWKVTPIGSPTVTMVLERSADGRRYHEIYSTTETAARCQSPFAQNDLNPLAGLNYYRLKTVDIDGKISYSNVVVLLNKDKGFEIVSLAPNPVVNTAMLSVSSAEKSTMEIVITDIHGKQLSKQKINLIAGNNQVQLNLSKIPAGIYQVSGFTPDGEKKTLRFVKQ